MIVLIEKEFLKAFLHDEVWKDFTKFGTISEKEKTIWAKKFATLDNAYVNFTHFVRVKNQPNSWAFTKFGIFHAWRRHAAYFMGAQFPCVDILIPVAYADKDGIITLETLAHILISVKNYSGTSSDSMSRDHLEEDFVLGKPNEKGEYLKPTTKSTILLSLRTIPFIKGKSTANNPEIHNWIESTEHNPYIAFAMSIGSGDVKSEKRFVPETQVLKIGN